MKNGFEPKAFRSYNLTPEEQHQQAEFIQENLKKGYIRPSKSPMASPFFFVSKKDRRLRPRLPIPQPMDDQKHTSPSFNLRHHGQNQSLWSQILHQI